MVRRNAGLAVALVLAASLAACQTAYTRNGWDGGYDDIRLGPDMYRITAKGNEFTDQERTQQILLLRAAELTLQNGFTKFLIMDQQSQVDRKLYATTSSVYTLKFPSGTLTIKMLKGDEPEAAMAYDAATIDAELRPRLTK